MKWSNILKVFKRDVKAIIKNPIALLIIGGICFIPSLYAWVNIAACWDPYENTSSVPIAVVNNDKGASFNGKEMNIGNEVIDELKNNHAIGWKFVDTKQGGLEFQIEQGGRNLSGGQKQRMTIARALVRKPEILILDDSASALDFATDAALRKSIKEMKNQPTVFIVSQRAASIQYADQIIVLDDGAMAGIGTHEELLKDCPVYQEIYYSQFPKEAVING